MSKNYFLDTSVMIHSPASLLSFEDNTVFLAPSVLEDLKKLRERPGEVGHNAREALHILTSLQVFRSDCYDNCLRTPNGGSIVVMTNPGLSFSSLFDLAERYAGTIITLDDAVRVGCIGRGIRVETYKTDSVPREAQYTGRCHLYIPTEEFDQYCKAKKEKMKAPRADTAHSYYASNNRTQMHDYQLTENEFVTLHDNSNPERTAYGRFEKGNIVHLLYYRHAGCEVFGVHAKNEGQIFALEALLAPADVAPLVILKGVAGTAKTFLAMAAGLEQTLNHPKYEGIIVSRPNVQFDEGIGFLPGDERQKVAPLNRPISDNIGNLSFKRNAKNTSQKKEKKDGVELPNMETVLMESDIISTESMSYMRGRSICNKFIFIDEAQNATRSQIVGMITRPGENTKIVLVGDPDQIDNKYLDHTNNGLVAASETMRGSSLCWQLTFSDDECVRSQLAIEAVKRFHPDYLGTK